VCWAHGEPEGRATRPQAGTSGAKWRDLSAAEGEEEEDNAGKF
jgi:hypothetical protein